MVRRYMTFASLVDLAQTGEECCVCLWRQDTQLCTSAWFGLDEATRMTWADITHILDGMLKAHDFAEEIGETEFYVDSSSLS